MATPWSEYFDQNAPANTLQGGLREVAGLLDLFRPSIRGQRQEDFQQQQQVQDIQEQILRAQAEQQAAAPQQAQLELLTRLAPFVPQVSFGPDGQPQQNPAYNQLLEQFGLGGEQQGVPGTAEAQRALQMMLEQRQGQGQDPNSQVDNRQVMQDTMSGIVNDVGQAGQQLPGGQTIADIGSAAGAASVPVEQFFRQTYPETAQQYGDFIDRFKQRGPFQNPLNTFNSVANMGQTAARETYSGLTGLLGGIGGGGGQPQQQPQPKQSKSNPPPVDKPPEEEVKKFLGGANVNIPKPQPLPEFDITPLMMQPIGAQQGNVVDTGQMMDIDRVRQMIQQLQQQQQR